MKTSYTKTPNLCNLRLFLFLMLFIVSGCQINQSMSILKEKLFSETDEEEKEDNEISKSLDIKNEVKESSIAENLEHKNKEVQKDEMPSELKDNKIKKEATLEKKESKETKVLRFKEMAQTRETESKIVSFFTKFFVDDAEVSGDKESLNNLTIQKIESKADKNKEMADSARLVGSSGTMLGDKKTSPNVAPIRLPSSITESFTGVTSSMLIVSPAKISLFATSFADINFGLF